MKCIHENMYCMLQKKVLYKYRVVCKLLSLLTLGFAADQIQYEQTVIWFGNCKFLLHLHILPINAELFFTIVIPTKAKKGYSPSKL
ncbi:hypothetical protein YC2023_017534 [Brassica napus]